MKNLTQPWFIRKAAYLIGALVVAVLGGFGILSEVQVDQWTGQLDKILPYAIGVILPLIAGAKTTAGSDDPATTADVHAAATVDGAEIARQVVEQISVYGRHAAPPPQHVTDYVRGVRGE